MPLCGILQSTVEHQTVDFNMLVKCDVKFHTWNLYLRNRKEWLKVELVRKSVSFIDILYSALVFFAKNVVFLKSHGSRTDSSSVFLSDSVTLNALHF